MVEIADKDFKAAIKIMLQWALINMFETDDEVEKLSRETESLSKERERIKKKVQNRNFRTEKFNEWLQQNGGGQRNESVNLKTEQ